LILPDEEGIEILNDSDISAPLIKENPEEEGNRFQVARSGQCVCKSKN